VTAEALLTLCASRGLRLSPAGDGVRVVGPKDARTELREAIREHKTELVSLLHSRRQGEVSGAYSAAFSRLSNLYDGDLVGSLWTRIVQEHPALARSIDLAEAASDAAALSYQGGEAPDSGPFLACLSTWSEHGPRPSHWSRPALTGAPTAAGGQRCSSGGLRSIAAILPGLSAARAPEQPTEGSAARCLTCRHKSLRYRGIIHGNRPHRRGPPTPATKDCFTPRNWRRPATSSTFPR